MLFACPLSMKTQENVQGNICLRVGLPTYGYKIWDGLCGSGLVHINMHL